MKDIQIIEHEGYWHALFVIIDPLSATPMEHRASLGLKAVDIYRKKAIRKARRCYEKYHKSKSFRIDVAQNQPKSALKSSIRLVNRNGYWYIHFTYTGQDGRNKRYRKSSGLQAIEENKDQVLRKARIAYLRHNKSNSMNTQKGFQPCQLVEDLIEKHMAVLKERGVKKSTLKAYNSIKEHHLLPAFGSVPISALTTEIIEMWFTNLKSIAKKKCSGELKKLSGKTKNNILNFFSEILSKAEDWGHIAKNPVRGIKRCKVIPKKRTIWTEKERDLFLETVEENCKDTHAMFCTSLFTGVRVGELLALSWEDINFEKNVMNICNNFVEKEVTTPKNGTSRSVNISPYLSETLQAYQQRKQQKSDLVFSRENKEHLSNNIVRKSFLKHRKEANVTKIRLHDMRHTFATQALMSGADLASVQTWLGHKDIHTTMRYINLLPEHLQEQIKKIDPVKYRKTKSFTNFDVFSPIEVCYPNPIFDSYNMNVHYGTYAM